MKILLLVLSLLYTPLVFAISPADEVFNAYKHPRFSKVKTVTVPKLQNFVTIQLEQHTQDTKAVFYPFGGPDIIYPLVLFPKAQSYLLIGLEPTGDAESEGKIPTNLNKQLDSLLRRSFFVTSDMSREIPHNQGVLPLFLAQIKLMEGTIQNVGYQNRSFGKILEITFAHQGLEKKLFYIKTNVLNESLDEELLQFIKNNNLFDTCMLKASSYALHQNNFSKLRDFILTNANLILQDDTGVPLKKLPKDFKITLFGNYIKPYGKEWNGYYQNDLRKLYQETSLKDEVNFCYGYGCGRTMPAIILATRAAASEN